MEKKYIIYARKSTESEDQQVQSLGDQTKIMKAKAENMGLQVVDILQESMSAKAPGRPLFDSMIERIKKGDIHGIIAWKLDRLSRNPVDTGTIQYMLQEGKINDIIVSDKVYTERDSGLLMSVESGMANQFIIDLKKSVMRGLNSKYEKGIRPSLVPIGYLNNKAERDIITDPDRFPIVRKMWDLMLTGNYSIRKIIYTANNDWGLRTVKKKRTGGGELTKSSGERIFRNIFYTGYFYRHGELIRGIHEPLISLEEYDKVQVLLGNKGKPRPKQREFSYTGMIRCGTCGCMITAETKSKLIKATNERKEYTYYHCTKKKKEACCKEKSILVEKLEDQIHSILKNIEIDIDFKDWIFAAIKESYTSEFENQEKIFHNLVSAIGQEERRLKKLTDSLLDEIIEKEEYTIRKIEIQEKIGDLKKKRDRIDLKGQKSLENIEKIFDFTFELTKAYLNGDLQTKKNILSVIGKNYSLKAGVLTLELEPWYEVIKNEYPILEYELKRLEPTKKVTSSIQTDDFMLQGFKWGGIRGSNPGPCP